MYYLKDVNLILVISAIFSFIYIYCFADVHVI